jgi:hypothetical protein
MCTTNISTNDQSGVTEEGRARVDFENRLASIIFNKAELAKILKGVGLEDHKIKTHILLENSSKERYSLELVTMKNNWPEWRSEIVVDLKIGPPTWEQYIDVTYGVGSRYDTKIIIFENGLDYSNIFDVPEAICEIDDLVNISNKCGVKTYLVMAKGLIQYLLKGEKKRISYELVNGPYGDDINNPEPILAERESPQQLPTKRNVQVSEFWIGYYLPNWGVGRLSDDHEVIGDWTPGYSLRKGLGTKAYWNDDGLFIDLEGEVGSDVIQWIWANRKCRFEEGYPGCSISLNSKDGQATSISVRISDIPITQLIEMDSNDKWNYGEMVYGEEHKFCQIAEEAIEDYDNETKPAQVIAVK